MKENREHEIAQLKEELRAAKKVIGVLVKRVEADINLSGKQYAAVHDVVLMQKKLEEQARSERELRSFSTALEELVTLRTRELAEANRQLNEKNAHLKELVRRDGLTGLLNHATSIEILHQKVAEVKRYGHPLSVILLDLDYFKSINDSYGHGFGDVVLKALAKDMLKVIRSTDLAGRFGGEEFIVIVPNTPLQGALIIAEKIRRKVEERSWEPGGCNVTLSAGVAEYSDGKAKHFLAEADKYLYLAKEAGRNRVMSRLAL